MSKSEDDDKTGDETQSRAERLTNRRSRSRERVRESTDSEGDSENRSQTGQYGQSSNTGQTGQKRQTEQDGESGQDGASGADESTGEWAQTGDENVKRENVAVYMYLDPRQRDRLMELFEDAKYHYRKSYDVELEKNRHVYPLILEYGLEAFGEMVDSPDDVRDALEANPYTPVIPAEVDDE